MKMGKESNKTAIDQMFDIIEGLAEYNPENPMLQSLLAAKPRLKEVEKEQIKEAWLSSWKDSMINPREDKYYEPEAEQYYNEQYGGEK